MPLLSPNSPNSPTQKPSHCGAIQPVHPQSSFFTILGFSDATFAIDQKDLKLRFHNLQKQVHPDKQAHLDEKERIYSDKQSTFLNKAYQTLRSPLSRAKYLLHLNGIHIDEGDSKTGMSPTDLMRIMDIWEAIEEVSSKSDLDVLVRENEERIAKEIEILAKVFPEGDLVKAKEATVRLQYWNSLKQRLNDVEF
ncbi:Co-chaperone Hsc20 [Rhizoclosmatium globosum]|uniref:Co-chaperone Hsc20 n=1 Tax=Rhizoclosmatium globosum TaxID=329046 RepID=A0A1Y2CKD7_9FUNG|nr:Co-chaperone Hsc20 [Rhizoclosmatium globosum]|eukprot:ORY47488.1 Co-chaperone Hsc20 [Rhizoclosmatium globosum]